MCFKREGTSSILNSQRLKLEDKFTYLYSYISSTEDDVNIRLTKAGTTADRLSIIWKFGLSNKIKRDFFQAVSVFILLYGCTTWTLTKPIEKGFDGNYLRMLRAILNKSWKQHPAKQQLHRHLSPILKPIQIRRTWQAVHCWRSKDEFIGDILLCIHGH